MKCPHCGKPTKPPRNERSLANKRKHWDKNRDLLEQKASDPALTAKQRDYWERRLAEFLNDHPRP